jgi:hypothetical protein
MFLRPLRGRLAIGFVAEAVGARHERREVPGRGVELRIGHGKSSALAAAKVVRAIDDQPADLDEIRRAPDGSLRSRG